MLVLGAEVPIIATVAATLASVTLISFSLLYPIQNVFATGFMPHKRSPSYPGNCLWRFFGPHNYFAHEISHPNTENGVRRVYFYLENLIFGPIGVTTFHRFCNSTSLKKKTLFIWLHNMKSISPVIIKLCKYLTNTQEEL